MASCIYSLKCCRPNALSPSKGIQWELSFMWHRQSAHHIIRNNSVACRPSLCQWTMQLSNLLIRQASNGLQTVHNPKSSSSSFCIVKSLPYNTEQLKRSRIHRAHRVSWPFWPAVFLGISYTGKHFHTKPVNPLGHLHDKQIGSYTCSSISPYVAGIKEGEERG